jgi:hypothetical protein
MDIGRCVNDAIAVYKKNWLILFLAAFLYNLLSLLSAFILCGPLAGGVCLMTLRALRRENQAVDLGDLFGAFRQFFRLFGMFWVTTIPILLGLVLFVLPGLALGTVWLFCFYLAVDKNLGLFASLGTSAKVVSRKGVGSNFLLLVLALLFELGPSAIPYLGIVLGWFVSPIGWLIVTSAYIQQVDEDTGDLADLPQLAIEPETAGAAAEGGPTNGPTPLSATRPSNSRSPFSGPETP